MNETTFAALHNAIISGTPSAQDGTVSFYHKELSTVFTISDDGDVKMVCEEPRPTFYGVIAENSPPFHSPVPPVPAKPSTPTTPWAALAAKKSKSEGSHRSTDNPKMANRDAADNTAKKAKPQRDGSVATVVSSGPAAPHVDGAATSAATQRAPAAAAAATAAAAAAASSPVSAPRALNNLIIMEMNAADIRYNCTLTIELDDTEKAVVRPVMAPFPSVEDLVKISEVTASVDDLHLFQLPRSPAAWAQSYTQQLVGIQSKADATPKIFLLLAPLAGLEFDEVPVHHDVHERLGKSIADFYQALLSGKPGLRTLMTVPTIFVANDTNIPIFVNDDKTGAMLAVNGLAEMVEVGDPTFVLTVARKDVRGAPRADAAGGIWAQLAKPPQFKKALWNKIQSRARFWLLPKEAEAVKLVGGVEAAWAWTNIALVAHTIETWENNSDVHLMLLAHASTDSEWTLFICTGCYATIKQDMKDNGHWKKLWSSNLRKHVKLLHAADNKLRCSKDERRRWRDLIATSVAQLADFINEHDDAVDEVCIAKHDNSTAEVLLRAIQACIDRSIPPAITNGPSQAGGD